MHGFLITHRQVEQLGELDFNLDYFTDVLDLSYLCDSLDHTMSQRAATGRQTNPGLGKKYRRLINSINLDSWCFSGISNGLRFTIRFW